MSVCVSSLTKKLRAYICPENHLNNYEGWFFGVAKLFRLFYNRSMGTLDITVILSTTITAAASVLGAYIAVQKGNHEREIKDAQREQRQADRLDNLDEKICRLEKKVDEHNNYGKKFGEVATNMTAMSKDIEYLKQRA